MADRLPAQILPANASALERALEGVQARLTGLDLRLADLWNPHACPPEFLPFLAASLSIDHWDSDWPEADKRGAIAAAMKVHAHKGTRGALTDALDGLGVEARITEWFEARPHAPRGTFALQLAARPGRAMDGPRQARAFEAARSAKRESQHMRMGIEARLRPASALPPASARRALPRCPGRSQGDSTRSWRWPAPLPATMTLPQAGRCAPPGPCRWRAPLPWARGPHWPRAAWPARPAPCNCAPRRSSPHTPGLFFKE